MALGDAVHAGLQHLARSHTTTGRLLALAALSRTGFDAGAAAGGAWRHHAVRRCVDGFDRRGDRVMAANTSAGGVATQALFPDSIATGDLQLWTGMRPATPRGEPLVGRAARGPRNLLLNTGHGALGFTLAFGTAQLVADALSDS